MPHASAAAAMSPLVRSLLALAALLAAAAAQPTAAPEPKEQVAASQSLSLNSTHCKEFTFGNVSPDNTVSLSPQHYLRSSNGSHELLVGQDACRVDGSKRVGKSVTICNQDVRGAAPWANVDGLGLVHLRNVRWGCTDDCPEGVTISVVEYCDMDGPGLGFRPTPDTSNVESTLIYYRANDKGSVLKWTKVIDDFLLDYRKKGSGSGEAHGAENRVACNFNSGPLGEKQVCDVPVEEFHPCTPENQYNYEQSAPCVFLELNKIFNWKPKPYNTTEDLPGNMPEDLKQYIKSVSGKSDANMVWVSCEGENLTDVENIGPVQYIPHRGFPSYYYPFTNQEGYLSPLVAVLFEKPRTGVLIKIECKAWAKNIFYDRYERRGSVHFELMVDRG